MAKILTRCPVCEGTLGVAALQCGRCKTKIEGIFDTCRFCRLSPDHLAFVELFLRCEGNLSRVEKELNLSYPTVRNRLQAALSALGLGGEMEGSSERDTSLLDDLLQPLSPEREEPARSDSAERRRTVLDALARGEMSAEDAAEALRDLS